MPSDILHRTWNDNPPDYVFDGGPDCDLFSVDVCHNGFFCGLASILDYVSSSVGSFDFCSRLTWSIAAVDEILSLLGYERDGKLHVYWCMPGKELRDGLAAIETDLQCTEMSKASRTHKVLVLYLDHSNFLQRTRDDVVINQGPSLAEDEASRAVVASETPTVGSESEKDSENDSDFIDSDCNAEEGDDDLFAENVDRSLNDCNEKELWTEDDDEGPLDDDDLQLATDDRRELSKHFRAFNPEVDMDDPIFRIGMVFSNVQEVRKAVTAYTVRNRVKILKTKNDLRRLDAICVGKTCEEADCPWMFKASKDSRSGGFVVTAYVGQHTCERSWEPRAISAKMLTEKFMHEFRDNQKLDLASFAMKVQREYNMELDRWKLSRARKAALEVIHGDEEGQFSLLFDYGQELRRSNPGSKFFITTNSVNDPGSAEHKQHLATAYWSYDACKRGFLEGCRPLICIDGCHIKTRYKGVLLTAVGIDPNDCMYPIAFGLVEVECTSSWEWFLSTLKDDLNITNTSNS